MSLRDLAGLPQDIPTIPAMGTPDEVDEMWHNAEHSYPQVVIKPFTGRNDAPLRPMQRQHLPLGHPDRIPYEERMYQFFRNYRIDVERGRIACSNEEYRNVLVREDYYKSLWLGETILHYGITSIPIDITEPESRRAFLTYTWSKDPEAKEEARRTLFRHTQTGRVNIAVLGDMERAGLLSEVA